MEVTRRCVLTNRVSTLLIPDLTNKMLEDWRSGQLIQDCMPELSVAEREFLITGTTQETWNEYYGNPRKQGTEQTGEEWASE